MVKISLYTVLTALAIIDRFDVEAFEISNIKNAKAWTIGEGIKFSTLDKLTLTDKGEETDDSVNIVAEKYINSNAKKELVTVATKAAVGLNFADIFSICG